MIRNISEYPIYEKNHIENFHTLAEKKTFTMLINLLTQNVSSHSLMKVMTHSLIKKNVKRNKQKNVSRTCISQFVIISIPNLDAKEKIENKLISGF